jgi:hypothetical protein
MKDSMNNTMGNTFLDMADVRRSSTKKYVPGASFLNKKKAKSNRKDKSKNSVSPLESNLKSVAESDSLLSESELDDILMQS